MSRIKYPKCICCGKNLTDPVSVMLGMGAICRMKQKNQRDTGPELFGGSAFSVDVVQGVICIIDLDQGGKSVTNDMENVLATVHRDYDLDVFNDPVIYRDSLGVWDGVSVATGQRYYHAGFYSLNELDRTTAILKAKATSEVVT
ncbi:DUF6011 domain-containing protein [Thiolinea disciformis]|uniref:DUF6011 domain-containing protein n=1 Tax=Thiolinea disciformis TaxID=125614 RepID=UPI0003647EED|nr:DUF6011 domain-containing protein [Thiolinea disciformis]